ncbi:MAG: SufE family protein [Chloroflexi bacterium]|nr:SufE family protein [Chloroflexota bacterium]
MSTIQEIQTQIIEDFSFLPEWDERYTYLIELGQKSPALAEAYRTDENLVRGCQSQVWLHRDCCQGIVSLQADSDSLIVKGLAALLLQVFSGQPAEAICQADLHFFEAIGLNQHLSSQRTNGLMAMVEQIKSFAAQCVGK